MTACTMRDGMAASGTCRRFSRPVLRKAVRSGGSSVTLSAALPPASIAPTRPDAGGGPPAFRTRGCSNTMRTVCAGTVAAARDHGNGACAHGKLAGFLDPRPLRVAEVVQPVDDLGGAERLAFAQLERPREHTRQHPFALAMEARFDLP